MSINDLKTLKVGGNREGVQNRFSGLRIFGSAMEEQFLILFLHRTNVSRRTPI